MRTPLTSVVDRGPAYISPWVADPASQAAQYFTRWGDRGERSYVTLTVRTSVVEDMVAKVCGMHPSVRCISRDDVLPSSTPVEGTAS